MHDNGKFGEIVYAESEYLHADDYRELKPISKDHWRSFNPAIKYLTHNLGPLLYIMEDKCVSVSCMAPDILYDPNKPSYVQNSVAIFKTAKGAVIKILIMCGAYVGMTHNFGIYGTRGMIEFDRSKPRIEAHSFAKFSDIPGSIDKKVEIPITCGSFGGGVGSHHGADKKMLRAFINCIKNDTPSPVDVDLGIRMALPGIFAHESYLNGGSAVDIIDVDDFED